MKPDTFCGVDSDIIATKEPEGDGIEFHVSMRDYTLHDMEMLIVEAAARTIVGRYGNEKLAKLIEERCIALTVAKVDEHLKCVTAAIIEQPVMPKFPGLSKVDEKSVTMREFIGLTGQAYLTARVNNHGELSTSSRDTRPRIQHLVEDYMGAVFKNEIKKATDQAIAEIRLGIQAQHKVFLEAEKARLREALAKTMAG
jgi:hypothetical protein